MANLEAKHEWLKQNTDHDIIYLALQGSQNYGQDRYDDVYMSDIDAKAISLPSLDDIINGNKLVSTTYVMDDNSHVEVKDIRLFKRLWGKANPSYLELLYTDFYIINNEEFKNLILDIREDIVKMNQEGLLKSIKGMSCEKHKALCHPYPSIKEKIDKYGYDPKQLHHILRLQTLLEDLFVCNHDFKSSISIVKSNKSELLMYYKITPIDLLSAKALADSVLNDIVNNVGKLLSNNSYEYNSSTCIIMKSNINKLIKNKIIEEVKDC